MKTDKGGIFGIKKPKGPTSHDIIDRLRQITGIRKIGHAGTLDPAAQGVLVVAIGRKYTKKISKYKDQEKEYIATIRLGIVSNTDDLEGEVNKKSSNQPGKREVEDVLSDFVGTITQKPPIYSAVKINGTPSYKLARQGKNPDPPPRRVTVKDIDLISYEYPDIELKIASGPGVYIRSIARDLGGKLGTGALLADLIRKRVGDFNLENSYDLRSFQKEKPYIS